MEGESSHEQKFILVTDSSSRHDQDSTPQTNPTNHSDPDQSLVKRKELPQERDFLFVTDSTSKKILKSHVTSQQHRRKRASRSKALSLRSSTATLLQSIRYQNKGRDLVRMLSPLLPPPPTLGDSEELLHAVSRAFRCSLSSFPKVDLTLMFAVDLSAGTAHVRDKEFQIAFPLFERGFRKFQSALRYNTSHALLEMLWILSCCLDFKHIDLYGVFTRYFYQFSIVIFGPAHPVSILTKMVCHMTSNPALLASAADVFQKAYTLCYDDAILALGMDDNEMAFVALRYWVGFSGRLLPDGSRAIDWDNRLFDLADLASNPSRYFAAKKLYAYHLHGRGDIKGVINVLEEIFAFLDRKEFLTDTRESSYGTASYIIDAGSLLSAMILEQGEQEDKNHMPNTSRPTYVARARDILEKTMQAGLELYGPKNVVTIQAIAQLASFNERHGAKAEAEAGVEFVVKELEEFNLNPEDRQFPE